MKFINHKSAATEIVSSQSPAIFLEVIVVDKSFVRKFECPKCEVIYQCYPIGQE